jgi:hypothetical protein
LRQNELKQSLPNASLSERLDEFISDDLLTKACGIERLAVQEAFESFNAPHGRAL